MRRANLMADGMLDLREARPDDAEALLGLQHALDGETTMMMLEVGERATSVDELRERLRAAALSPSSTVLMAVAGDELVGHVSADGGVYRRTRHSAYVVIGVSEAWRGRGVGRALLGALDAWARANGIRRLELTVRVDNVAAHRLYERAGYTAEGVRRASLRVGDEFIDEIAMARLLDVR